MDLNNLIAIKSQQHLIRIKSQISATFDSNQISNLSNI